MPSCVAVSWELNSGTQAYKTNTLPIEPLPIPSVFLYLPLTPRIIFNHLFL